MTTVPTERRTDLSDRVAEEVRALLGRRRMSGAELARRLGVSPMWVSYRLGGRQPIDLNDLERIAGILSVGVADLLPPDARRSVQDTQPYLRKSDRPTDNRPAGRPNGRVDRAVTKPQAPRRTRRILHPEPGDTTPWAA